MAFLVSRKISLFSLSHFFFVVFLVDLVVFDTVSAQNIAIENGNRKNMCRCRCESKCYVTIGEICSKCCDATGEKKKLRATKMVHFLSFPFQVSIHLNVPFEFRISLRSKPSLLRNKNEKRNETHTRMCPSKYV